MRAPAAVLALAACSAQPSVLDVDRTPPRLVVLLVIDQWPEWAFEEKRPELHAGGFDRLLSEGAWHVGRHPTAVTLTAPGHALLGTGATPNTSGILGNEWWHREADRVLKSVEEESGAVSAKWLLVPGLGDAIVAAHRGGKAVAVSLKDRAAILPLGHAGTAIWYSARTVDWATNQPSAWLDHWNRESPIAFHLHDVWRPLDAQRLRRLTGRRDAPIGEVGEKGFGPAFPHALDQTKQPAEAVFAAPIGNQIVLETALAAIDGEGLGRDATPDLLVVSLSAHDLIAHGWGHESWEAWDATFRLDADLATFLAGLDARVGAGRWAMIVTSDHGASHLPELVAGGRLRYDQVASMANAAASTVLGPGAWIADATFPSVFLSAAARTDPRREQVIDAVVRTLRAAPGIEIAARTLDVAGACDARPPTLRPLCLGTDPERSGEIVYMPAAGWVMEDADEPVATAHGSSHDYDQLVPVVMLSPGRNPRAPLGAPDATVIRMEDIAGILAGWLGVTPPNRL